MPTVITSHRWLGEPPIYSVKSAACLRALAKTLKELAYDELLGTQADRETLQEAARLCGMFAWHRDNKKKGP